MKTNYLVFISYGHGAHYNTVVDSIQNVVMVLENSCDEISQELLDEISLKTALLENEKNFYMEFDRGTWATITRMDINPTDLSSLSDRETVAIINALRNWQREDDRISLSESFGLDDDGMSDGELDDLIEWINFGGAETAQKPVTLTQSLKDRIRILSEAEAIGHMVCDDEPINFDDFMKADDVFEVATICELFEHHVTDAIQEHVNDTASVLETFANNIINTLTTSDMLDIIGQRAYDAGVVSSRGNICLTSIHSITASQRDTAERCSGASSVNDEEVFINTEEYDGNDEIVLNAAKFGVSYVLAI